MKIAAHVGVPVSEKQFVAEQLSRFEFYRTAIKIITKIKF